MRTAIDSSVLLDVLIGAPEFREPAKAAIRRAASEGALVIGECVLAELAPVFGHRAELEQFLGDNGIEFIPSTRESATLAGEMYRSYLARRPGARRVVPDFLIGAHALLLADRLLARDGGYYRDYFKGLTLLTP